MADFIVAAILAVVIGCAIGYIVKAKKNGSKCIGCPYAGSCASKTARSCGCHSEEK